MLSVLGQSRCPSSPNALKISAEPLILGATRTAVSPLSAVYLQTAPAGSSNLGLLMILAVFAIFYFLLIMPVQRRQKKIRQMHSELKAGDRVITQGGLRGTIISVKDDSLLLKVAPDSLKLEFVRSAVAQVLTSGEEKSK